MNNHNLPTAKKNNSKTESWVPVRFAYPFPAIHMENVRFCWILFYNLVIAIIHGLIFVQLLPSTSDD